LATITRTGIAAAGLRLLAQHGFESDSVTAFRPPTDVAASQLLDLLRRDYGVEAQGGQAHLADQLIRVGHMGWVYEPEMRQAVDAIVDACARLSPAAREAESLPAVPARPASA
jgi:aspartate aminotransferase-like enzyme